MERGTWALASGSCGSRSRRVEFWRRSSLVFCTSRCSSWRRHSGQKTFPPPTITQIPIPAPPSVSRRISALKLQVWLFVTVCFKELKKLSFRCMMHITGDLLKHVSTELKLTTNQQSRGCQCTETGDHAGRFLCFMVLIVEQL